MHTLVTLVAQTTTTVTTEPSSWGPLGGGLIWAVLIGLVVGVIAKLLTPGRDPGGCIVTSLIGIAGSLLAFYVGKMFGHYGSGLVPGLIASVIGSIVILLIYRAITGRSGGGPTV